MPEQLNWIFGFCTISGKAAYEDMKPSVQAASTPVL